MVANTRAAAKPRIPAPGSGYLAGAYPDGITRAEGVPGPATIRVLYRPTSGALGDGVVIAEVQSGADGTWRVDGLNTSLRYDVVCRLDGYQDAIVSDVTPATD
ncbi:hypothetical protein IPC102_09410 [Pseudomonas aeruginosa]|uniref:hypothetical protein n=1 Tax=Pseudomonas aeruginosa TaxID=287 RepID=UPI000F51E974|nr:hypothetical protein [Pseudomonas aeruginosa]RQH69981.1 hypothetical protein IPC102_09410 [Pseudomonas aeruginosa]